MSKSMFCKFVRISLLDNRKYCEFYQRLFKRDMSNILEIYQPPDWAKNLKKLPRFKVKLANPDTPIHDWDVPGTPSDFKLFIKRDDMTGSTLSGNKVRKLAFLMADAVSQNCKHVITCGGIQSNHCRAVAVAARQLGMQPHLVLRSDEQDVDAVGCEGNLLLDRLCGANIYLAPRNSPFLTELKPRMDRLADHIQNVTGDKCYRIPVGGSESTGVFGYITAFEELMNQGLHEKFDDIVFASGSGGTAAGLAIANYLTGCKVRIHGIAVSDDARYFHQHVNEMLHEVGLTARSQDILDIIDGYKGQGYGISTQEELDFIVKVSLSTGIMLDPVYTGKAVKGLIRELNHNPDMFKGNRILFIHTGGIFGLYDGRIHETLKVSDSPTNSITLWDNKEDLPV